MTYRHFTGIGAVTAGTAITGAAIVALILILSASPARPAAADAEATTAKECGACHMAYLPQFLPARSWQALMKGLDNHFGENANLDAATRKTILDYLVSHAADAPGQDTRFLMGLPDAATPLRISDTPYWIRRHSEIPDSIFSHPKVKSKGNCTACHQNAAQGGFEDE